MGVCTLISFLLSTFFLQALSSLDFRIGSQVSVSVPSSYQPIFIGRAYILDSFTNSPKFRAALTVRAISGRYFCSLIVLFDDLNVWASDHVVKFIPAGTCVLELTHDGNLQLKDQHGLVGWQSDTSNQGVKMLRMDERIGNLVLIDGTNRIKWQCLAHPTNTILWSQELTASSSLTAFPTNSSVFYSFEIIEEKIVAYINWRKIKYSYWQFKPHGNRTIGFIRLGIRGLKIFNHDSHKIAQILSDDTEPIRLFTIGIDGNLRFYHYSMKLHSYKLLSLCDLPLACGLYGICSLQNTCRYLQPRSIREKINDIFNTGMYNGLCELFGADVKMVQLKGVETTLTSPYSIFNISEESCVTSCMGNCSCASVTYSDKTRRCCQFGLVAGTRELYEENEQNFWVKMPKEKRYGPSNDAVKNIVIIGGVINLIAILIIVAALIYYCSGVRNNKTSVIPGSENS